MALKRVGPALAIAILAAAVTAFVLLAEMLLLWREVGSVPPWGVTGSLIAAPIRFVLYLVAFPLMYGWREQRPPLSRQVIGSVLLAMTTFLWVPVEIVWTAVAGRSPW